MGTEICGMPVAYPTGTSPNLPSDAAFGAGGVISLSVGFEVGVLDWAQDEVGTAHRHDSITVATEKFF